MHFNFFFWYIDNVLDMLTSIWNKNKFVTVSLDTFWFFPNSRLGRFCLREMPLRNAMKSLIAPPCSIWNKQSREFSTTFRPVLDPIITYNCENYAKYLYLYSSAISLESFLRSNTADWCKNISNCKMNNADFFTVSI